MKKLILLTAIIGLILVGCQDQKSNPISPDNNITLSKKDKNIVNDLTKGLSIVSSTNSNATYSKEIDGKKGGDISFTHVTTDGKIAYIDLKFKKDAFEGSSNIEVAVNFDDATISFTPHLEFSKNKVTLDASFIGVDLNILGLDNKRVDFYYFPDNGGEPELIKNNGVKFGKKDSSVSVKSAHLEHFSRYGWATKD